MDIGTLAARLLLILFAAVMGEAAIEFLLQPVVDLFWKDSPENKGRRTVLFNFTSAILGMGIAFGFSLRLFELLGGVEQLAGLDAALTGILLGRGSNYVHGLIQRFFAHVEVAKQDSRML